MGDMTALLTLLAVAGCNVAVSLFFYLLESRTRYGKAKNALKQILTGLIFGLLSVLGTELGVDVDGVVWSLGESAPLCAGLIFGAPSGLLAGIIGGAERWFAVFWGTETFTRAACSVSILLAGMIGACLRKILFDDRKPTWQYGLLSGTLAVIVHMLLIFLTNMQDVYTAFLVVQKSVLPMVLFNGGSVMFATFAVSLAAGKGQKKRKDLKKISQTFQKWLFLCVAIAFLAASVFAWSLQTKISKGNVNDLLRLNIQDVQQDILDATEKDLLDMAHKVASDINRMGGADSRQLCELAEEYDIVEINIIDKRGVIEASTFDQFIHYNMHGGAQSAEFLVLLDGKTTEYVQSYQQTSSNSEIMRKYAGVVLDKGGFVQIAYDAEHFQRDIDDQVVGVTRNRHVGENGYLIIADEQWNIVSDRNNSEGKKLSSTGILIDPDTMPEKERFTTEVYGETCYCMYVLSEGYYIIAVMPKSEALFSRNVSIQVTLFKEFLIFAILFVIIYYLIKELIVKNMEKVNASLGEITGGNLEVEVDVRTNEEFASLSDDINSTVATLKQYIAEAAARIDQELAFAQAIQYSALPSVFPPYPNRTDFAIFASMKTAKEVGGDFYDFYLVGEEQMAFLIADVSGKGIPAALFMMTAKTLIKSLAEAGHSVEEIFTLANEKLCETNDAGMFVTAWMGILDLKTGHMEYSNAGHNPPLIRKKGGCFSCLSCAPCFVLAGMEGIKYRKNELDFSPGDEIYLYTDGVTEAMNAEQQLYGEERLLNCLNAMEETDAEGRCRLVKEDLDQFVGEAAQFDDITMLSFQYIGEPGEKSKKSGDLEL